MEVHLVADTNLFFECKSLEQLPWLDLGYDSIVILLTKPVLDEIDRHKKATGRTRSRALDIFSRVRVMLTSSVQEIEIQPCSPKVVLRRAPNVTPDPALKEHLDYAKTDEKLVGIVSTLSAEASGYDVKLFTDDTGPATSADGLNVPYLMIDENWRRPLSETTEEKRIKELEKDLATYRAQEPKISISCETADEANFVQAIRKVATPLAEAEIEQILGALRLKQPLVTDFTPPAPLTKTSPSGEITTTEYVSPAEDDLANYRDTLYPRWIEECRRILQTLHEGRDEIDPPIVLRWSMSNEGTRPASHVRIEFEAKGPLRLQRLRAETERKDEEAESDKVSSQSSSASLTGFPSAPRPPAFVQRVTRTPQPAKPKTARGFDISTLRSAASLDEKYKSIASASKLLGLTNSDHLSQHLKAMDAASGAARLLQQSSVFGTSSLDSLFLSPSLATIVPQTIEPFRITRPYIPPPRKPEAFYYDWPATHPVDKGTLTCDLWRHQTDEEVFEFEVLFTKDGEARGTVGCTVHAQNLTKPEQARVIVSRIIEPVSMIELANNMVEACN